MGECDSRYNTNGMCFMGTKQTQRGYKEFVTLTRIQKDSKKINKTNKERGDKI